MPHRASARGASGPTRSAPCRSRPFIVGELPEIVEHEIDGNPIPIPVVLPVTVNGRIFPREDVDLWTFEAKAGQTITCTAVTARLGSPFDARLEIRDSRGARIAESAETSPPGNDVLVRFTAPADGTYTVAIHDLKFGGLQHYVYRLTIVEGSHVDHVFPLGGRRGTTSKFEFSGINVPAGPVEISLPVDVGDLWRTNLGLPGNLGHRVAASSLDDQPELVEQEPNGYTRSAQVHLVDAPIVCNGRIGRLGDVDCWGVSGPKGLTLEFDLRAARLGSPLDSVIALCDREGKELARSDDATLSDSFLRFTFPEAGPYFVKVE